VRPLHLGLPATLVLGVPWTWRSLAWGLQKGLIGRDVAVEAAVQCLSRGGDPPNDVVELAGCSKDDPEVESYVSRLSKEEPSDSASDGPWLYLVLRWVLENKDAFGDPLQVVEEVYADFGYPEAIAKFVRYMPSDEPDLGREANEARLFEHWRAFLEAERARLSVD
jgi:hypothetical protein